MRINGQLVVDSTLLRLFSWENKIVFNGRFDAWARLSLSEKRKAKLKKNFFRWKNY